MDNNIFRVNEIQVNALVYLIKSCAKVIRLPYNMGFVLSEQNLWTKIVTKESIKNVLADYKGIVQHIDYLKQCTKASYDKPNRQLVLSTEISKEIIQLIHDFSCFFETVVEVLDPIARQYDQEYAAIKIQLEATIIEHQAKLGGYKFRNNLTYGLLDTPWYKLCADAKTWLCLYGELKHIMIINESEANIA